MFKYTVAGSQCKNFDAALKLIAQNLCESDSVNCKIEFDNGESYSLTVKRESNQIFFEDRFLTFTLNMMLKQTSDRLPKIIPRSKSESIPRLSKDSVIVAFTN